MQHAGARRHLVLSLLGVLVDQVMDDDPRGNGYILRAYRRHIDAFFTGGGDPEIPKAVLGVKEEYLGTAFEEMQTTYGNFAYLPFDPTASATLFLAGMEFRVAPHFIITPNDVVTAYERNDEGVKPRTDLQLRVTFFLDFD